MNHTESCGPKEQLLLSAVAAVHDASLPYYSAESRVVSYQWKYKISGNKGKEAYTHEKQSEVDMLNLYAARECFRYK